MGTQKFLVQVPTKSNSSETRFFGYDSESKKYDAQAHRDRIFGKHVADYMRKLKEEDPEAYKRQFSQFIVNGIEADDLEKASILSYRKKKQLIEYIISLDVQERSWGHSSQSRS